MTVLRRAVLVLALALAWSIAGEAQAQPLPALTDTVNDFARIVDPDSRRSLDDVIRALQAASGDVIVVATVPTIEPSGDIREYAVKLFENQGRGIGGKGKDNGLLVLVAVKERRVWIEVGYGLEEWVTDGFAGETTRDAITPEFRAGRYGPGLVAGVTRLAGRIAEGRNVTLTGVPRQSRPRPVQIPLSTIIFLFILIIILSRTWGGPGRPVSRWGRRGWSGWSGGVGPFGGGGGGGFGGSGGGFGGGFGGFGGGRSGGGGGGGGW